MLIRTLFYCCALIICLASHGQKLTNILVQDHESKEPLIGALIAIEDSDIGVVTSINGKASLEIPDGPYTLVISFVGYETKTLSLIFPLKKSELIIELESGEELEEVIVTATRSSRSIENTPTRIEAITSEELGEKAVMNSSNISMLLRESSGIMVQQTSANSGNQTLRIQGLDGRYTQLLKDGFPLFGGFAGGLSIMQVPPLDLQQVEVIKGSASTLYGGGAIAGLVNLVSKQPQEDNLELSLMLNQTSAGGTTLNSFYSQHYKKTGLTLYAVANRQDPYDPNRDNFSDIPKVRSVSLNPKFFWYPSNKTKLWIGLNGTIENRIGGDLDAIKGNISPTHAFSEQNLSDRYSSQAHFEHRFSDQSQLTIRNSINYFDREITIPDYAFHGQQLGTYSEITYAINQHKLDWIMGVNFYTDSFKDVENSTENRDYQLITESLFAQNNWDLSDKLVLESGFRLDHNHTYGYFPLPRISVLFKSNKNLTYRVGGGLGYKLPTIFNEESEVLSFQGIEGLDQSIVDAETSRGVNFDINYQGLIGDKITLSVNQLFFYTQLKNTLILQTSTDDTYYFDNSPNPVRSVGFETNIKLGLDDFKLFLQYSYTDVEQFNNGANRQKPLTAKHNFGATLMYEVEEKWRVGYELYYIGNQYRSDYTQTQDYWMMGIMAMREFERLSIFLNFENFTDTRQSRFQDMIIPPATIPTSTEIWAPTDGFVANGGVMIRFM
ncbi:MAG TPA: TonB-dependent receptor [Cytophagales bacterium]|nr:TonB-dependent receptor [Cytophagales bacterium]